MLRYFVLAVLIVSGLQIEGICGNTNWPDWRGPTCDGVSDATGLPLNWSETKNIVWKTPIHDLGYSTPVIWGRQIWLTTATLKGKSLYAVCVDFESGRIIHDIEVFSPEKPQRINRTNSYATPSATIEEGFVYVHFGTHGTACINTKTGKIVWKREDLNCNHLQGPVSSPLLYKDMLIIPFEGIDVQFTVALDKKTGDTVWRYDRPRNLYEGIEPLYLLKSYHTPVIVNVNDKDQLINSGAMLVTGHEPETGKEIWRVLYRDDNPVSRVVTGHGLMFINSGGSPGDAHLLAVRQGGKGDVTDTHVVWKIEEDAPSESSPVLAGDLLYLLTDKGLLTCKEAVTGKTVWSHELEGKFGASLLYADGRIYISSKEGVTTIIKPGRKFEVLAVNHLDGFLGASPAVKGRSLILRSKTHLYRIEDKAEAKQAKIETGFEQDVIETDAGNLTMAFIAHGTVMFAYDGRIIHVDPVGRYADYSKMPKADLILITHEHGDHLDNKAIGMIVKDDTKIVISPSCEGKLPGIVMKNGDSREVAGFKIEAVPAYNIVHTRSPGNPFHPRGNGNGYIITFGDKKVYVAGDTENTPEMKALEDIDVAFLPMNLPYTMTPEMVADAAKAFKPAILYPYHYGSTDTGKLLELMKDQDDTEVRIRKLQ